MSRLKQKSADARPATADPRPAWMRGPRPIVRALFRSSPRPNDAGGWLCGYSIPVSYTHLRAHETRHDIVCRLLLEKKKNNTTQAITNLRNNKEKINNYRI